MSIMGGSSLGTRLAEVIAIERISMREFARRVGISSSHLSALVRDRKVPGSDFLVAVKTQFGISVDWLLSGEGDSHSRGSINTALFDRIAFDVELAFRAWMGGEDLAAKLWFGRFDKDVDSRVIGIPTETRDAFIRTVFDSTQRARATAAIYNRTAHISDPETRDHTSYTEANALAMLFRKPEIATELRSYVDEKISALTEAGEKQSVSNSSESSRRNESLQDTGTFAEMRREENSAEVLRERNRSPKSLSGSVLKQRVSGDRNLVAGRDVEVSRPRKKSK